MNHTDPTRPDFQETRSFSSLIKQLISAASDEYPNETHNLSLRIRHQYKLARAEADNSSQQLRAIEDWNDKQVGTVFDAYLDRAMNLLHNRREKHEIADTIAQTLRERDAQEAMRRAADVRHADPMKNEKQRRDAYAKCEELRKKNRKLENQRPAAIIQDELDCVLRDRDELRGIRDRVCVERDNLKARVVALETWKTQAESANGSLSAALTDVSAKRDSMQSGLLSSEVERAQLKVIRDRLVNENISLKAKCGELTTKASSAARPIQLEEGKQYVCRNGNVTAPLKRDHGGYQFYEEVNVTCTRSWTPDGRFEGARAHRLDIVREHVEKLVIEPGCRYVRRDGGVTGVIRELIACSDYVFTDKPEDGCVWRRDGKFWIGDAHPSDLVAKAPVKLEAGKSYVCANGEIVGPLDHKPSLGVFGFYSPGKAGHWSDNGVFSVSGNGSDTTGRSSRNIVKEAR